MKFDYLCTWIMASSGKYENVSFPQLKGTIICPISA